MRKAVSATLVVLALAGFARAQDLSSTLSKVGSQYGQAYVAPAVDAFGMDLNSGLFHGASMSGLLPLGLHVYVGVQISGALIQGSEKSFNLSYLDTLNGQPANFVVTNAPTIYGNKDRGTVVITPTNTALPQQTDSTIGGLISTSIVPVPIPQIGLGSLFGTDVLVRFLPQVKISDYGKVQLFGIAVRHSISQYIPLVPIDIAVQLGFQNLSVTDTSGGDLMKASTFAANLEISKTFLMLTLYGGLQVESSSVDVSYTYNPGQSLPSVPVSFSLKGKNKFRALAGLSFSLGPVLINGDYSFGSMSAATLGIGIAI